MNVLNILYTFNSGGVERLAIDVSNELARTGNSVHLCVISENYTESLLTQLEENVHQYRLKKSGKFRKIGYLKQVLQIIDKNKIEVVHVHQGTLMPFYTLLKVLRPRVRFYLTIHDTYIFSELSKQNRQLSLLTCSRLIAISDAVVDDVQKNGGSPSKIVRVYNGVDFSRFPIMQRKEHPDGPVEIVNVARFFPAKKGQDLLIKAVAILREKGYNVHVSFAGGEITEAAQEIPRMQELALELGVGSQISFLGNVSNVCAVLENADCFCIPSRYEGFGISAVEAMGTGLPCVASDIVGLNEVVNDTKLGAVFEKGNEKDLAEKLEYVMLNRGAYSADVIGANVRSRFSIEQMAKTLLNVYQM